MAVKSVVDAMKKFSLVLRYQPSFHGVDLSALRGAAVDEYFRQPIVVRYPPPTKNFTLGHLQCGDV